MSGRPSGPPQWPFKGGYLKQPARLVSLADGARAEFLYLGKPDKKKAEEAAEAEPPPHTPVPSRR